jgi:hypothetical protein
MPCSNHAVLLKATAQHVRQETAHELPICLQLLLANTRSSTKVVTRSIPISDAGDQCETKKLLLMDEVKLIILVQRHECLYHLQHKDYDNNLVKDNLMEGYSGRRSQKSENEHNCI